MAVTLVSGGAQDYLFKRDISFELLRRSIRADRPPARRGLAAISEERYAVALAGARDGIWDWNLLTGALHWSLRCRELLHLTTGLSCRPRRTGLTGCTATTVSASRTHSGRISAAKPYLEYEFRINNGAGEMQWVLCRGVAVRDGSGLATRVAGSLTDVSERKAAEARLRHEVLHDTLTGLPNRALFLDRLDLALKQHRREPTRQFAVLFLDLDRFKMVNDSLGHAAGDELLIEFEAGQHVPASWGFGRQAGGDEFAILLNEVTGLEDAARVADRIHEVLLRKFFIRGKEVYASVSIGIALSAPHYEHRIKMLRDADLAMTAQEQPRRLGQSCFEASWTSRPCSGSNWKPTCDPR